jgi:hypothetical protein
MSTIESIVRELEKIPEPMQLSLLDFIRSLGSNYPVAANPERNEVKRQKTLSLARNANSATPRYNVPLITCDNNILRYPHVKTIW